MVVYGIVVFLKKMIIMRSMPRILLSRSLGRRRKKMMLAASFGWLARTLKLPMVEVAQALRSTSIKQRMNPLSLVFLYF